MGAEKVPFPRPFSVAFASFTSDLRRFTRAKVSGTRNIKIHPLPEWIEWSRGRKRFYDDKTRGARFIARRCRCRARLWLAKASAVKTPVPRITRGAAALGIWQKRKMREPWLWKDSERWPGLSLPFFLDRRKFNDKEKSKIVDSVEDVNFLHFELGMQDDDFFFIKKM